MVLSRMKAMKPDTNILVLQRTVKTLSTTALPVNTRNEGSHVQVEHKLQALVYDIFPSTTALFSYAIGSRKLSANEQFFCWCSTVVSLLQTTQIISDVCFITDHVAYGSSNQTKIV